MKYKVYHLLFDGDAEVMAFLTGHVKKQWATLGEAREVGRAAALLFGVRYKVTPITRPQPARVGRVLSL